METALLAHESQASLTDLERLLEATGCIEFGTRDSPQGDSPNRGMRSAHTTLAHYAIGRRSAVAVVRTSELTLATAERTFQETAFFLHFPSATAIPVQELYAELPDDEPPYANLMVGDLRELHDQVRFTLAIRREDDAQLDRVAYIAKPDQKGNYSISLAAAPPSR